MNTNLSKDRDVHNEITRDYSVPEEQVGDLLHCHGSGRGVQIVNGDLNTSSA